MKEAVVTVEQGVLCGRICDNIDGKPFYSFRGIPYAAPPIGKLRFKAPLPPATWNGIFDATKDGNCCHSKDLFSKKFQGSEDCLNLNIYTPTLPNPTAKLLPVMVWIHGGGFTCGSNNSQIYGPEFLITSNIVLVVINYRLGLLGFLSFEDPCVGIPGNVGFKDMIMALQWVQNNIEQFNGDPNNVTVFGESAGGAAAHLLMLSPMSKGLFHKVIAQSGCALNPWSRAKQCDQEMFEILGLKGKNTDEILEHLQGLSVEELLQNQDRIEYFLDANKMSPFGLVIERPTQEQNEQPFMCQEPIDIILSGNFMDVPFMIGYTKLEGLVVDTYKEKRVINMVKDFRNNVPHFLGCDNESKEATVLGQKIKEFYYSDKEPCVDNKHNFYRVIYNFQTMILKRTQLQMVTDNLFLFGIYSTVKLQAAKTNSPIYFYRMSLESSLTLLKVLTKNKQRGAAHGDDVAYLFKSIFTSTLSPTSPEYKYIKRFVQLWTNFAHHARPASIWKHVTDHVCFLDIGQDLVFHGDLQEESLSFWAQIYGESSCGHKFVQKHTMN